MYTRSDKNEKGFEEKKSEEDNIVCWECYDEDVVNVCHHCGRFLCEDHTYILKDDPEFSKGLWKWKKKLRGLEHTAHCIDCIHPRYSVSKLINTSILLLFFSLSYFLVWGPIEAEILISVTSWMTISAILGFLLLAIGISSHYFLNIKSYKQHRLNRKSNGTLPLLPDLDIEQKEKINCEYNIEKNKDKNKYLDIKETCGEFHIECMFTQKEKRRHKKFEKLYNNTNILEWDFGVLGIDNTTHTNIQEWSKFFNNKIFLKHKPPSQNTDPERELTRLAREQIPIKFSTSYKIDEKIFERNNKPLEDDERKEFPIKILPKIGGKGDEQVLTLRFIPESNKYNILIKEMTMDLPGELVAADEIEEGKYDDKNNKIKWSDLILEDVMDDEDGKAQINIRFRKPLKETSEITADFEIHFEEHIISGLEVKENRVWIPSGFDFISKGWNDGSIEGGFPRFPQERRERNINMERKTVISGNFNIDTSVLSNENQITRSFSIEKDRIYPDHHSVERILKSLTEDADVYIKKVDESPPRVSETKANIKHRYWDIKGKKYWRRKGVYPVDVHLVVRGEEKYGEDPIPKDGDIEIEVTIRGKTSASKNIEWVIDDITNEIEEIIKTDLEDFDHPYVIQSKIKEKTKKLEKIEERLEMIEEALYDGTMSQENYDDLKEKLLQKKKNLQDEIEQEE